MPGSPDYQSKTYHVKETDRDEIICLRAEIKYQNSHSSMSFHEVSVWMHYFQPGPILRKKFPTSKHVPPFISLYYSLLLPFPLLSHHS